MVRVAWNLLLALLVAATAGAGEARLVLPDHVPPDSAIDGMVEVVDAGRPVARIELPPLDGASWERVGGPELLQVVVNGVASSTERHRLRLTATRAGELAIPAIAVHLHGGGRLETAPRTVSVRPGDERLVGDAVCWAEFSPATAIVGQPVSLLLTCAFARDTYQIEGFGLAPPSQATVLATVDDRGETYGADGRRWRTLTRRWTLTFPAPGEVSVRGQQEYVPCERFGTGFVAIGPRRRMPIPATLLRVRPMPPGGPPEGWNGLVAPVTVEATLDRDRIALGDGARLTVRVRGTAAGLLTRPPLPVVAGLEARPREDAGERDGDERTFAWDLQPAAAGRYVVAPPPVAYFDPAAEAFRAARATPPILLVDPGRAAPVTIAGAAPAGAASTAAAITLPPPSLGTAPRAWTPGALATAAALAALVTAAAGMAVRWRPRPRRRHRGRTLAAALRRGDLAAAAATAAALRADLPPGLATAADAFEAELAAVRFGGAPPTHLAALAAPLEALP